VVSGLGDDPASGGFRWNNPIRQAQDGLRIMADASGGFAVTDTDDFRSGLAPIAVSALALGYADGPRVPVAPLSIPRLGGWGRPPVRAPSPLPFPPSLDREFTTADTLRLYFEVFARDPGEPLQVRIEVVDGGRQVVQSLAPPSKSGRVDVLIPLATTPPSAYILRATFSDQTTTAARDLGFVVRQPSFANRQSPVINPTIANRQSPITNRQLAIRQSSICNRSIGNKKAHSIVR
jgi:hypothetical protein